MRDALPPIVEAVEATGRKVAWVCDPMHGNTFETVQRLQDPGVRPGGRRAERLLRRAPGARHLARRGAHRADRRRRHRVRRRRADELAEADLVNRYETACDPRLNRNQSLELAFMVAERLTDGRIRRVNPVQEYSAEDF